MRIAYFTHSLASCWNHGNAHFLRGVLRALAARGHGVRAFEPENGWSLANLLADHGEAGLAPARAAYPELRSQTYGADFDAAAACTEADLVLVDLLGGLLLVGFDVSCRVGADVNVVDHPGQHWVPAVSEPTF